MQLNFKIHIEKMSEMQQTMKTLYTSIKILFCRSESFWKVLCITMLWSNTKQYYVSRAIFLLCVCVCVCVHTCRCGQAGAGMEKRKGCFVLFFVPTCITTGEVNHKSELVREKTNVKKEVSFALCFHLIGVATSKPVLLREVGNVFTLLNRRLKCSSI